jgi:hypothetical protein
MRKVYSLSGEWSFQLDPDGLLNLESFQPERTIPVPMPIQAAFPELQRYSGHMWYQRTFTLSDADLGGELLLEFGAVDYWCQVYVNGQCVGEHEGGYTPFRYAIRQFVHAGENTLAVYVYDKAQDAIVISRWLDMPAPENHAPPFQAETIPHGKQTWYIDASGIWQEVSLIVVPSRYIERVQITPDIHSGVAQVRVILGGAGQAGTVRVNIGSDSAEAAVGADDGEVVVPVQVTSIKYWTPDTPILYTAEVQLGGDSVSTRFGFREITTRDGKILLNGQPFYLLCALDQDLYPDTIYTVPSDEFLRDQFTKAKQLGLNSLRCHIKPPDPRYLDLADEIGLLIWSEIPSWRTFHAIKSTHPAALYLDDAVKARARAILVDMIARDYNHPSLMIWTIVNEDWGTALLLSESDRAWVAEMVDLCRQLDPTRLVVDNSPCPAPWGLSVHVKSDLDDFHVYTNIPDNADVFRQFVEQFSLRPLWSFSNTGDAQRTGREPIVLSEFGNWGMPSLKQFGGGLPDWAHLSGWWSPFDGEAGRAEGLLDRFDKLGLKAIWGDYEAFATATQEHEFNALKYEIDTMRRLPTLQGYVITELSDIYWESNGLLDFARGVKAFHETFGQVNAEDVIVPQLDRYAYWDDETARVRLYASHYSAKDWKDAEARATSADDKVFSAKIGTLARGEVRDLGRARWRLPKTETARMAELSLSIEDGGTVAQNNVRVLVLPTALRKAAFSGEVATFFQPERVGTQVDLWAAAAEAASPAVTPMPAPITPADEESDPPSFLVGMLQSIGYRVSTAVSANTKLMITDEPTPAQLEWVRAGGDMLYLASSSAGSPFYWVHGRGGTYGGRWITSWSWLRPGVYRRVAVENPVTLPFIDMMPSSVILGLPVEDSRYHNDFLAGQISGWVQHPAIHTVQFRYGKGRVVMTTYPLRERLRFHPLALAMLHDLVDHLTSDACQPALTPNFG